MTLYLKGGLYQCVWRMGRPINTWNYEPEKSDFSDVSSLKVRNGDFLLGLNQTAMSQNKLIRFYHLRYQTSVWLEDAWFSEDTFESVP